MNNNNVMTSSSSTVTSPTGGSKSIRKGVERPKPLKCPSVINQHAAAAAAEQVVELYGKVAKELSVRRYDRALVANIVALNNGLKVYGLQLEQTHKHVLDRYQAFLRAAARDGTLDLMARLQLLEIIELRAMNWQPNENVTNYYKHKLMQVEQCDGINPLPTAAAESQVKPAPPPPPASLNANASEFQPVSTAKFLASASANLSSLLSVNPSAAVAAVTSSGDQAQLASSAGEGGERLDKPQRAQGKPQQQLRDEVVIRNADSGKVDAGAKDRLVQILGPDEVNIQRAKGLIEGTIARNKTPELDNNNEPGCPTKMKVSAGGGGDAGSGGTYSYTVEVGGDQTIKILGGNADLVRAAKMVLDKHFAANPPPPPPIPKANASHQPSTLDNDQEQMTDAIESGPIIRYDRRQLLIYSNSPICRQEPTNWSEFWGGLKQENPHLARNVKKARSGSSHHRRQRESLREQVGATAAAATGQDENGESEVEEGEEEEDYFKPDPDLFLHKTPRFPEGFVCAYPRSYNANANNQQQQQPRVSHLDRLFSAGAVAAAAAAASDAVAAGSRPKRNNGLPSLLTDPKVWDDSREAWVSESQLTANTRT